MSETATPSTVLPRPIPFGKYFLLERINTGGMAEVYKAKAFGIEGFERLVAVKKILPAIAEDTEFIRMFVDEAKLAGQLHHAGIAQIFDLGRVDDTYYIAMEYVSGKDLRALWDRTRKQNRISPIDMTCYIVMKVCEALDYAHNKADAAGQPLNIVHRDVSPQNMLFSYEGEVKLIDFGVAKAANSTSETRVGILKGKLSYMSPEQVRGLALDRRSDIFSLGIVLYEMLTGERLFLGDSDFETLEKIRKVEVAPPTLFNTNIPRELEDIVLRALKKNPADRYQSMHELQVDLQRFMFNNGLYYSHKDLAHKMREVFAQEIAEERQKLEYFRSLQFDRVSGRADVQDGLEWEDEESETQVFDKEDEEPGQAARPEAFVPPSEDVVWAKPREKKRTASQPTVGTGRASPPSPAFSTRPEPRAEQPAWERLGDPVLPDAPAVLPPAPPARATGPSTSVPPQRPQIHPPAPRSNGALWAIVIVLVILAGAAAAWSAGLFAPRTQSLEVASVPALPNAVVLVAGQPEYRGGLPHTFDNLPPGPTAVTIRADGYRELTETVDITPGAQARFERALQQIRLVSVQVTSTPPGATVLVAGQPRGTTPVAIEGVEAGELLDLRLQLPGHSDWERQVIVREAMPPVEAVLAPSTATLSLVSQPTGATWTLRDAATQAIVATGVAPGRLPGLDLAKSYSIQWTLSGHREQTLPFAPTREPAQTASVTLEPERGEVAVAPPDTAPAPGIQQPRQEQGSQPRTEQPRTEQPRTEQPRTEQPRTEQPRTERPRTEQPRTQPEPEAEPTGTGALSVQCRPAARVFIDGEDTGRYTPLIGFELSSGRHRVRLVNEEFGFDRSYTVDIQTGRTRTLIGSAE